MQDHGTIPGKARPPLHPPALPGGNRDDGVCSAHPEAHAHRKNASFSGGEQPAWLSDKSADGGSRKQTTGTVSAAVRLWTLPVRDGIQPGGGKEQHLVEICQDASQVPGVSVMKAKSKYLGRSKRVLMRWEKERL